MQYLGSLLDTKEDVKRQKGLTIDSYKTFESIFSSKHVSKKVKSICNIHRKYLHVQLGTMDLNANPGKQHRCVLKEDAKKNYQCQMAQDDLL